MGRRGSKPRPTALHLLRGKPYVNEHEPKHALLDVTLVPDEIASNAIARAEWERIAPTLVASGHVTLADRAALIGFCVKYAHWREREQLAAKEPFLIRGQRGTMVHPAIKIADQAFLIFLRAAVEIGLTPSSRSRIIAHPSGSSSSKWHGALK